MIFKETKAEIIIQLIGRSINRKKKNQQLHLWID